MSQISQQSQDASRSASSMVTKTYLATMLCEDEPSVQAALQSGVFSRAVKMHIEGDPVWAQKHGEPADQLFVSTDNHVYNMHAHSRPVNAEGHANFDFTPDPGLDSVLEGFEAEFTCDRESEECDGKPKNWTSISDGRGPHIVPGTFKVRLESCGHRQTLIRLSCPPRKGLGTRTRESFTKSVKRGEANSDL